MHSLHGEWELYRDKAGAEAKAYRENVGERERESKREKAKAIYRFDIYFE